MRAHGDQYSCKTPRPLDALPSEFITLIVGEKQRRLSDHLLSTRTASAYLSNRSPFVRKIEESFTAFGTGARLHVISAPKTGAKVIIYSRMKVVILEGKHRSWFSRPPCNFYPANALSGTKNKLSKPHADGRTRADSDHGGSHFPQMYSGFTFDPGAGLIS